MIEALPFETDHFTWFVSKDEAKCPSKEDLVSFYSMGNTDLRTVVDQKSNLILGFVGMLLVRAKVIHVTFIPSIYVDKFKISLVRFMRGLLADIAFNLKLNRIEFTIDNIDLWKWAETLGFFFEARLKGYGPNKETEYLFVRLF